MPTSILGQKLGEEWLPWHAGDPTRFRILGNDSYIVRSLEVFRRYEMTIGITYRDYLGTEVLIPHKGARLLKLRLE